MNLAKILVKQKILIVAIAGFGLILGASYQFILKNPAQNVPARLSTNIPTVHKLVEIESAKVSSGFPVRLKIPQISVDTALDYVVLTPEGDLGAPKGPTNAGWYAHGPRPGETGNSVIDGHFGWVDNTPAVFDNLHKLHQGDNLYVEDERGATVAFVVRELKTYGPSEDDSAVFRSSDGKAHLNLITCGGDWNKAQKSYSDRLVVFADKEI